MVSVVQTVQVNAFTQILAELMARRSLYGVDLARQVGLSENAISAILRGSSRPRRSNFMRILSVLTRTKSERDAASRSYLGEAVDLSELDLVPLHSAPFVAPVMARVSAVEEVANLVVDFRDDVQAVLEAGRFKYRRDFGCDVLGQMTNCDFVIGGSRNRIVVECKRDLNSDWALVIGTSNMVKWALSAAAVVIVVPYENSVTIRARDYCEFDRIRVVRIDELEKMLRNLGA